MEECVTEILEDTLVDCSDDDDDDDGPYIEIELDNKGTCMEGDVEIEQKELRISISLTVPEVKKENVHSAPESKVAPCIPRGLWEIPQTNIGQSQPTLLGISATPLIPYQEVYCK